MVRRRCGCPSDRARMVPGRVDSRGPARTSEKCIPRIDADSISCLKLRVGDAGSSAVRVIVGTAIPHILLDDLARGRRCMETTESALTASESREPRSDSLAESDEDRFHPAFVWTAAALVMAVLWIKPMVSSLWTDELGTWWVINGSAHQVVDRAQAVRGQSPIYYLIAWLMRLLVGRSEFWLRFPSLVFALAAAFLIYRIAKRLIDVEAARIAVVTFAVW